ncbi:YaaC family protein [Sporolactobacillus spathodeae]|uniref:YaaC family protein n=1 Tax=Sporolactobacillus spathodeae TaxID=1465502 RepID=UPI003B82F890
MNKLPSLFERDFYNVNGFSIRTKRRIKWVGSNHSTKAKSMKRLSNLHKRVRHHIVYISGTTTSWYLKRANLPNKLINRSSLPLIFAAMHRLSELSRYENILLYKHLNSQENWLLTQFIELSRFQFIDEISSEITGQKLMKIKI